MQMKADSTDTHLYCTCRHFPHEEQLDEERSSLVQHVVPQTRDRMHLYTWLLKESVLDIKILKKVFCFFSLNIRM